MKFGLARTMTLGVMSRYYRLIELGLKRVEGRTNTPDLRRLNVGDRLHFQEEGGEERSLTCRISHLQTFDDFPTMLKVVGLQNLLPGIESPEEGVKIYRGFPGYPEQEAQYGVLAIHIQRIENGSNSQSQ